MGRVIRVLIVDDSDEVRRNLGTLLEMTGFIEVAGTAKNGFEAIDRAGELSPDVVLMDLEMPGMNGFEAARRVKELLPGVRVVVLSAHCDEESRRNAESSGAERFVWKGDPFEQLLHYIAALSDS